MGKGFGSVKSKPEESSAKSVKLTPISQIQANLSSCFNDIKDPRVKRTKKHLLKDILVIAILAVIAGSEGWEDIENYAQSKQQWLSEFLELPNGIPSDDTFRRVFERLDPSALEHSFTRWVEELIPSLDKQIVPIDGKCLRGSYDREGGLKALHLVTAWVAGQNLTLGQVKVEDHSNEITAIPALLELINVTGAIVTIDAMGTQTEIVRLIQRKKLTIFWHSKAIIQPFTPRSKIGSIKRTPPTLTELKSLMTVVLKKDIIAPKNALFGLFLCLSLVVSINKGNGQVFKPL